MAGLQISYEVKGMAELVGKLQGGSGLIAAPLRTALTRSALLVQGEAQKLVPVDTGNLRRTITHRVDSAPIPTFAIIGTNAPYAIYVHEGRRPGKMPPVQALLGWARRHGVNPYVLARAIGRRGIRGRPFLRNALQRMRGQIDGALRTAARQIEANWRR